MINGSHVIIYSANPEADRAFFRDVLDLPHVDVGRGWLIFGLPPAEVAVHPADAGDAAPPRHELYLMCEDVTRLVADLQARGIACSEISEQGWGRLTTIALPGGGSLGAYEPRHARPPAPPQT
jgi:catechol 2,3-dioxygenase-like lactoylglutathione lyase family enzyme